MWKRTEPRAVAVGDRPVTGDRLMYRRTYDGWGYSPLDQITADNVAQLEPVWSLSTGVAEGHEVPAIVNAGTMFITTPENQVLAVDARTGELPWRYRTEILYSFGTVGDSHGAHVRVREGAAQGIGPARASRGVGRSPTLVGLRR